MSHRRLWVAAGIIALVILAVFALSAPHTRDVGTTKAKPATASVPPVTLHDTFKKGVHTITGSLDVPNVCTTVSASATATGEGILVAISTISDTGVCLQLPVHGNFSTTVVAPAHLKVAVTVNGSLATTTSS